MGCLEPAIQQCLVNEFNSSSEHKPLSEMSPTIGQLATVLSKKVLAKPGSALSLGNKSSLNSVQIGFIESHLRCFAESVAPLEEWGYH